jgi:hypothetical protein
MLPTGEGWAVGTAATIRHRSTAGAWSTDTSNVPQGNQTWNAVASLSATEGWAVGTSSDSQS